jgi:8-oxo-dGTP diphosphatase
VLARTTTIVDPVENERGERLVSIMEVDEADAVRLPATFALVIARHDTGYLLVRNKLRAVWELPGGFIDVDETARQCAARELAEESGQKAVDLRWLAAIKIKSATNDTSYGALYRGFIIETAPFDRNSEIDSVGFWPASRFPTDISSIDRALLAYFP